MSDPGRILIVCTGNVCRSPFIERLLRRDLEPRWGGSVSVTSAGTGALVGQPMDERAAEQLRLAGGDPGDFEARQLRPEMVEDADLVLTATREHRGRVAQLFPRSVRYTFAFVDFAQLADGMPSAALPRAADGRTWLAEVMRAVAARRGLSAPLPPRDADVVDPYRRKDRVFVQMASQVQAALPPVVRALGG